VKAAVVYATPADLVWRLVGGGASAPAQNTRGIAKP
jgi:hypothetical protein